MKNPNGYGSVVKLSGNRRNPFVARKTKGFDARGYPIYEVIGYYKTREEGLIALAKYNNEPWNLSGEKTTFEELFNLWREKKAPKLGKSNRDSLISAAKHCTKLYNKKYKEIRAIHMQDIIDNCGKGYATQGAIKNLFGHLDNFAFELDIINKRYSEITKAAPIPETKRLPFTDEEVVKLWEIQREPWADSVIFLIYTGFRLSEFLSLRAESVNIEQGIIQWGMKTAAGKNRIVPIHNKIRELVKNRLKNGGEYLFSYNGKKLSKSQYYKFWNGIKDKVKHERTVHETRHTLRTKLDSAGANKVCIDLIMGHKSAGVGERVYTHKTILELKETVNLLKFNFISNK